MCMCMTWVDYLYLRWKKGTKYSVYLKLLFLSKKGPGSNFSGLGNSLQLKKTKDSNAIQWCPGTKKWRVECYFITLILGSLKKKI